MQLLRASETGIYVVDFPFEPKECVRKLVWKAGPELWIIIRSLPDWCQPYRLCNPSDNSSQVGLASPKRKLLPEFAAEDQPKRHRPVKTTADSAQSRDIPQPHSVDPALSEGPSQVPKRTPSYLQAVAESAPYDARLNPPYHSPPYYSPPCYSPPSFSPSDSDQLYLERHSLPQVCGASICTRRGCDFYHPVLPCDQGLNCDRYRCLYKH